VILRSTWGLYSKWDILQVLTDDMFMQDTLNDFISDGKTWRLVRNRIAEIFDKTNSKLR
jgi:hypothetical protein